MTDSHPTKKFATDLTDYAVQRRDATGPYADNLDVDVLIVGGGFGGVFVLKELREQRGLRCVLYEAGPSLGGTWRWNRYPGARVDSEVPEYEFSWPEVWRDWNWSTNYPDYRELRAYFDHVDRVLDIKRDCAFETVVVGAEFDTREGKWNVVTSDGRRAKSKYFVVAAGFVSLYSSSSGLFLGHVWSSLSHHNGCSFPWTLSLPWEFIYNRGPNLIIFP